ncbi:Zinc finger protein ZAT5 [Cardamine amara subsp. amara]|uniref:Zinc finger protein ZAT5 n=1 Tax=Cardamine amara subsp. amara TaxID=228776 RepID=A0ABD0ZPQ0_CARAN
MTSVHEESGDHARLVLLIKGKRTKRQRSASPLMNAAAVSSVCSGERSSLEAREEEAVGEVEFKEATDEDEDMANCLMLLSQGHKAKKNDFFINKKSVASLGLGVDGVYQCKTCDKSFHSFQALGGHRASHKKPKLGVSVFKCDEKKTASVYASAVETVEARGVGSFLSLQVTSSDGIKKPEKTHECSICKAEFSSGQALGGHMRRHRGLTVNANANANATSTIKTAISSSSHHHEESIQPKNFLQLDLNLPAPEDERCCDKPKFAFASKEQILLFAAASNSLIDCHH